MRIAFFIVAVSSARLAEALLRQQHDLADVAALGDELVRLAGPLEGERLGDDRLEAARLEVGDQRLGDAVEVALPFPPARAC